MFIYIITSGAKPIKIGYTKDINQRLKQLQTGYPQKLFCYHSIEVEDKHAILIEKLIHKNLKTQK